MTVKGFGFFGRTVICEWWTSQGAQQEKEFLFELLRPAPVSAGVEKRVSKGRLLKVSR